MRTIVIKAETDSDESISMIKMDVMQELSCCSTFFDMDTLDVYEEINTDCPWK